MTEPADAPLPEPVSAHQSTPPERGGPGGVVSGGRFDCAGNVLELCLKGRIEGLFAYHAAWSASRRIELPRVHHVVPFDHQDVRAEPVRAGRADRGHLWQWNGECPAAIVLECTVLYIHNIAMYNAAMYSGI